MDESTALVAEWAKGTVKAVDLDDGAEISDCLTGVGRPVAVITDDGDMLVGDWTSGTVYETGEA